MINIENCPKCVAASDEILNSFIRISILETTLRGVLIMAREEVKDGSKAWAKAVKLIQDVLDEKSNND